MSLSKVAIKPSAPIASTTYWCENGAVYQMPSSGYYATVLVGFVDFNAYAVYCSKGVGWGAAPNSFYGRAIFSNQDFPVVQDTAPNPNKNPTSDQYQVCASAYAAPFASTFMGSVGLSNGFDMTISYTLITWAQASALAVQTSTGPKTVSLQYLTLSNSKTAKYGTEIIWIGPPL
jgi:hypothetical protein